MERHCSKPQQKVAIYLPTLAGGGAQRVLLNVARGLARRGVRVDLVLAEASGPLLDEVAPAVNLVDLRAGRVLRSIRPLTRYLRETMPCALISGIHHANLASVIAARLAGVGTRTILTLHSTLSKLAQRPTRIRDRLVLPFLIRRIFPRADSLVAVSSGVADDLASFTGIDRRRIQVLYNPVITPEFMESTDGDPKHPWLVSGQPPVVIAAGRLVVEKDYPLLLNALARVREDRDIRLIILGEGPLRTELEQQVQVLGLRGVVDLPGFVDNPASYIRRAEIYVMSSRTEGLPTALIEALALGKKIVSTDCESGPREILRDGELGTLVPVGDRDELARAILRALDAPVEPETLQAGARAFHEDGIIDRYVDLLKELE